MARQKPQVLDFEIVHKKRIVRAPTFLKGPFLDALLEEFNGRVARDFDNSPALCGIIDEDGNGNNPYASTLVNQIVRQIGLSIPTPAEIEEVRKEKLLPMTNTLIDSALVLGFRGDPNRFITHDLLRQMRLYQTEPFHLQDFYILPIKCLSLRKEPDAPFGLAFNISDSSQSFQAPILGRGDSYVSFSEVDESGMPIIDKNGKRTLFAEQNFSGTSRLRIYGGGDYHISSEEGLIKVHPFGRIFLVESKQSGSGLSDEYLAIRGASIL